MNLTLDDFDYVLPPECIAQAPLAERSASRLLVMKDGTLDDRGFTDLPDFLAPGDLIVMNDTRVMHARLYGQKATGGQVEVLVERMTAEDEVLAQVRASKPPKAGSWLRLEDAFDAEVIGREGEFYRLRFHSNEPGNAVELIERYGKLPLPPYIERQAANADEERYQTVYARERGSVAAPTAGLHFDAPLLERLRARGVGIAYVTLHVGAGTFQPVRVQDLAQHHMHVERYVLPQATADAIAATQQRGGRIVAIGTTTLRTLESVVNADGSLKVGAGETALFVTPGYRFCVADLLITNFHLPKSTLLMLVSAFGGTENIRAAYAHAIDSGYRFFSYGDAMLIHRQ
ncbi:MAG: tRNA preQ1(34) S-adenosylmethionine ribosyltransferase-isomerase QueA [Gammaproteobacteria bacterium]|nr:tRNA preQ1(34) S-adenosylmethionine ribosyltransferase-isomerase QueA [Rhodocyclaceae bacterium]MBU3909605.1 tRNA preQ1(34) S-adenosylmethionine ribosyltransferase-isomerase QueA [Gammaproteobacteria bacterium]MBU3987930.1 tRNA preQ1(34) S-adenosylmethionine ribosyltransferase-isomerase QueA [Gammaproteobacteria bacterium]MBU4003268.1 tRNA preQ1(34) S-adenosylmethionine ribosyltransferase-isomerase QueA [Gammaproteobacteria bacterium]MBU4022317.1 tRNA preQ1(34) S-adenosylmethionine ribosyltr